MIYKIENNVSVQKSTSLKAIKRVKTKTAILRSLQVGQSILASKNDSLKFLAYQENQKGQAMFITRSIGKRAYRVWRIE